MFNDSPTESQPGGTGDSFKLRLAVYLLVAFVSIPVLADEPRGHWPQWRGPQRDNVSPDAGLLTQWPENGPPVQWSVKGIGNGIAAVAVADGRVFTLGDIDGQEFVMALDERTGQRLWATAIGDAVADSWWMRLMRWLSQRTPTIDGERLYALTAKGVLVCLTTDDGTQLWRKDYREDFGCDGRTWGFCDYPLVDGDALICLPMGARAGIVALDKVTGAVLWQGAYEQTHHPAYAAMLPVTIDGFKQYVATVGEGIVSFSAADGALLWKGPPTNDFPNTNTPIVLPDGEFFCPRRSGIMRFGVRRESDSWQVGERYTQNVPVDPFQDGNVAVGEHLYLGQTSAGILGCVNLRTGEVTWRYRLPRPKIETPEAGTVRRPSNADSSLRRGFGRFRGSAFQSDRLGLTYADGHLYGLRANGSAQLIRPDPTGYVETSSFEIPDYRPGIGATLPVVTGGQLYLRDDDRLLCFDVRGHDHSGDQRATSELILPKPLIDPSDDSRSAQYPIFVTTPNAVVDKMLQIADVEQDDVVVDLGSGDGRIVISAAKQFGCRAIGYEIDTKLVMQARDRIERDQLGELVTIHHQDMYTADLSDVDVVTVYLYPEVLAKLKPNFARMKPGSRIVSHLFEIPGATPSERSVAETDEGDQHVVLLYTLPLK